MLVPDLWWYDESTRTMTVIEVEAGNPVSDDKLSACADVWFYLDCINCELTLLVTDRWISRLTSVPLCDFWWAQRDRKS
jgi:hypothetical protein